jgi:hypothetical protein
MDSEKLPGGSEPRHTKRPLGRTQVLLCLAAGVFCAAAFLVMRYQENGALGGVDATGAGACFVIAFGAIAYALWGF